MSRDTTTAVAHSTQEEDEKKEEVVIESNWTKSVDKFDDLGLKEDLLRGIYGYGFVKPSPIQQKGILPVLEGKDTIAQAQSGTGKTATFTIASLQIIDHTIDKIQALIVSPTRELATQISDVVRDIGQYLKIKVHACIGGTAIKDDIYNLKSGVHVIVGTPGRVFEMMKKGFFKPDYLKLFVLDEADEMLSRGFKSQIQDIFRFLPA